MNKTVLAVVLSLAMAASSGCGSVSMQVALETAPAVAQTAPSPAVPARTVESIVAWDFDTQGNALGWRAANDLASFTFNSDGLSTASTAGDPYMIGPSIHMDTASVLHLEIRMRSSRGNDAQVFWQVDGQDFNEQASQHFAVKPDGQWHTYRLDLNDHPAWKGTLTRLRLDTSAQSGADLGIAWIHAVGALPANLQASAFGPTAAILTAGEPFDLTAVIANNGDLPAEQPGLRLELPAELKLVEMNAEQTLPVLAAGIESTAHWRLSGPAGVYTLGLLAGNQRLKTAAVVIENSAAGDVLEARGDAVRMRFARQAFGYGIGNLEWKNGEGVWQTAGRIRSLGRVIYRDASGAEHEVLLYAARGSEQGDALTFEISLATPDGAALSGEVNLRPNKGKPWFNLDYTLKTDKAVQLLSWSGPEFLPGEGSFGAQLDGGLFPGLEFLGPGERSSAKDFVAPPGNLRYVPNGNKITLPLMAVTAQGGTYGLMWDPLQTWDGTHDRPAALFAAPNTWENQANHLLRLFAPGTPDGLEENRDRLSEAYPFQPGQMLRLSAALFAAPAQDTLSALDVYLDYARLNEQLAASDALKWPRSWLEESALCLRSYTQSTWDASTPGWHYALPDPWGPGSNPAVSLHLWVTTLTGKQDDSAQALRRMVRGTLSSPVAGGQPNGWFYQPALTLQLNGSLSDLRAPLKHALEITARQRADGSWGFPGNAGAATFGQEGDTSNGYTATQAFQVLYYARLSGNPTLVSAGRKALDYLAAQPLHPEGAQTWELSLHVPDLLAASWVMQSFIEGYRLTGETRYLALAERWALSGLPFIYTWNAPDRPVMRYTTIPVFGASNYTSPWFGRPVMWNGLDYALGLQALAAEQSGAGITGLLDWRRLAEGIAAATAQMQPEEGPYAGMYPDGWDTTTGEEAYTWWLSPTYLMQNLLLLQGNPAAQISTRVVTLQGVQVHINAAAQILEASSGEHSLTLRVRYSSGESAALWIAGLPAQPQQVSINAVDAPLDAGWTGNGPGWIVGDEMLLVRIPFPATGEALIQIDF